METENYTIKTPVFEGPFGLLLNLIESRKLFINDVSLSQVTEEYISYIKKVNNLNPNQISSFMVVAATLILIKSKSLLPNLNLTAEEEGDIYSLEDRLRLFELFSRLSENLKNTFGEKIIFAPQERKNDTLVFLPDEQITMDSMMVFANEAVARIPKKVFLQEVEVRKVISIEEMINKLEEKIQETLNMNFKDFAGNASTREEKVVVIVGFLAMLELVRQGIVDVMQENNFQDMIIQKQVENSEIKI